MAVTPVWTFGDRLHRIRKTLQLDQAEMGKLVGVSMKTVGRWEKDRHCGNPYEVALAYAKVSGYEVEWILGHAHPGHLQLPNSQDIRPIAA